MWIRMGFLLCLLLLTGPPASTSSHWSTCWHQHYYSFRSGWGRVVNERSTDLVSHQPTTQLCCHLLKMNLGQVLHSVCHLLNGGTSVALVDLWWRSEQRAQGTVPFLYSLCLMSTACGFELEQAVGTVFLVQLNWEENPGLWGLLVLCWLNSSMSPSVVTTNCFRSSPSLQNLLSLLFIQVWLALFCFPGLGDKSVTLQCWRNLYL